jgi:hypothetical protein
MELSITGICGNQTIATLNGKCVYWRKPRYKMITVGASYDRENPHPGLWHQHNISSQGLKKLPIPCGKNRKD